MKVLYGRETCDVYWISRTSSKLSSDEALNAVSDLRYLVTRTVGSTSGFLADQHGRSDVVSASWSKDTHQAAGVFNCSLVLNRDYGNMVRAGDLLVPVAGFQRASQRGRTLLSTLVVDSVTEDNVVTSTGAVEPGVSITARDLGKVPHETSTVLDPAFAASAVTENAFFNKRFFTRLRGIRSGSPVEMVMRLIDDLYNSRATGTGLVQEQWRLSPNSAAGISLMNLVDLRSHVQAPMFGYWVPNTLALAEAGTVWELLKPLTNPMVNEFFVDVRDLVDGYDNHLRHAEDVTSAYVNAQDVAAQRRTRDAVANDFVPPRSNARELAQLSALSEHRVTQSLVFRQLPYDTGTFNALPVHEIDESELLGGAPLTRSESEAYNAFRIRTPAISEIEQELVFGLLVNAESIKRHGFRYYHGETLYPLADARTAAAYQRGENAKPPSIPQAVFDYYVGLVSTWFAYNEDLYATTLPVRYRPDIRVGNALNFTRTIRVKGKTPVRQRIKFYIQGVRHNFNASPGGSSSTLELVRGVVQDEQRPEANLYFTKRGPSLKPNPYEKIQFETARGRRV